MAKSNLYTSDGILPPQIKKYLPYYLLTLAVLIFYSNVYENTLFYDDEFLLIHNKYLRSFSFLGDIFTTSVYSGALLSSQFYRPLQNFLYLIVYQTVGPSPFCFHFLNIALHIANTCLVYTIGCRLKFNTRAVFIAALLWALHPIHTEGITYTSATAVPLHAFFCLLGVAVLLPDFTPRKFLIAAVLFVFGLLSKESAIVFPLLAMCSMYLLLPGRRGARTYLQTWPLWAVALCYLSLRFTLMPPSGTKFISNPVLQDYASNIFLRIYTCLATVPAYLRLLIWPTGLHLEHDFPVYSDSWHWQVMAGITIVVAFVLQILYGRGKRGLALSWGLMWLALAMIPQTGILMPVNSFLFEHWMYLPSVGLFLGVAQTIATTLTNSRARMGAAAAGCLIAFLFGIMTWQQNKVWHDPITFFTHALQEGETSVNARNNLAKAYIEAGDDAHAIEQLQLAVAYSDITPSVHENIAAIYVGRGNTQQAISHLKRAIEIDPDYVDAYDALAGIYDRSGDKKNADSYHRKADEIRKKFRL